jgi:hypothetical protein
MRQQWSRRQALQLGGLGMLGLGLGDIWAASAAATPSRLAGEPGFGKAKSCILMFMWGGPSQLDTWDLKPNAPAEIRGDFRPIATSVPSIQVSEHFPLLAKHAEKYAVIRSLTHDDPAHLSSVHHLLTGRYAPQVKSDAVPPSRKDSPHIGSVLAKFRPPQSVIPPFVSLPWTVMHPAAPGGTAPGQNGGWLGPAFDPFLLSGDPNAANFQVSGLNLADDVSPSRLAGRRELLGQLDLLPPAPFTPLQDRAFDLLTSTAVQQAFDLNREPAEVRDRYGRHIHGQCLLMARRMIEAGVNLVGVNWHQDGDNFWDTHGDNFNGLKNRLMPPADKGFSALLADLDARGMLDETLLVWVGEFGRRPQISAGNAGREHWPWCYSGVLAGGGIQGGQVYGRSDSQGAYPAQDPVSPGDLAATIYHALGVPVDTPLLDRENRPQSLAEGDPILSLF